MAQDRPGLAAGATVGVTIVLASRGRLHRLVRDTLTEQELHDGLIFAAAALIVLPLVPDRGVGPEGALNPFTAWRLVVIVMAINGLGYVALRLLGPGRGCSSPAWRFALPASPMPSRRDEHRDQARARRHARSPALRDGGGRRSPLRDGRLLGGAADRLTLSVSRDEARDARNVIRGSPQGGQVVGPDGRRARSGEDRGRYLPGRALVMSRINPATPMPVGPAAAADPVPAAEAATGTTHPVQFPPFRLGR